METDTHLRTVAVGAETLSGIYLKNLEGSKNMDFLREVVDQNYNPVVMQRLKVVMDDEAWQKLVYDPKGIKGTSAAWMA